MSDTRYIQGVFYELKCGHDRLVKSSTVKHYRVYCSDCDTHSLITGVRTFEWHLKCPQCKYSRWTGASREEADGLARRHIAHQVLESQAEHYPYVEYAPNPRAIREFNRLIKAGVING
jgi:hypothetical protein